MMTKLKTRLVILCTWLLIAGSVSASEKAIVAEFQAGDLVLAVYKFAADCHRFPTQEEGLAVLLTPPADTPLCGGGAYLEKTVIPKDPWGVPYVYVYPARFGAARFDLYSRGRNGIDEQGKNDDVSSWKGYDPSLYSYFDVSNKTILGLVILFDLPVVLAGWTAFLLWRRLRKRQAWKGPTFR